MLSGALPEDRLAGTIAAIEFGVSAGARIVRVHDVAHIAQYLRLRAALHGDGEVEMEGRRDDDRLKWIAAEVAPRPIWTGPTAKNWPTGPLDPAIQSAYGSD